MSERGPHILILMLFGPVASVLVRRPNSLVHGGHIKLGNCVHQEWLVCLSDVQKAKIGT